MMFRTLNEKFENSSQEIIIEDLEVSSNHWSSLYEIRKIANALELLLYSKSNFHLVEKNLINLFLSINKKNSRINKIHFYHDQSDPDLLICLCISSIKTFKPDNILQRKIKINLKQQNKIILFVDLTTEEFQKIESGTSDSKLPTTWNINQELTSKYSKYRNLFF